MSAGRTTSVWKSITRGRSRSIAIASEPALGEEAFDGGGGDLALAQAELGRRYPKPFK